ncbi:MAG: DUF924 family protein [Thiotrichales bacterium]
MATAPIDTITDPAAINEFWFSARVRPLWFNSTAVFDAELIAHYQTTWEAARSGRLASWESTPAGALALVIVLDQLPLNMFRGTAQGFATEQAAREVAARAIERGDDQALDHAGRAFLYLPFMHSEDLVDQDRSVALFEAAGLLENLRFARHHREIIQRFGRFPHRNAILGRPSTPGELAYLSSPQAFHG